MTNWQKLGGLMLASLSIMSHANTYVVDTFGGAALQPIVQNQLNQLPNGGNVMVYQERLVINTTPQNYAKVRELIRQIDRMPQMLTVSVRVGENSSNYENTGYGNIGVINNQVYLNGRWQNNQSQTIGNQLYQVQTLSGKPASIGLEQFLPTQAVIVHGRRQGYYPHVFIANTLLSANQGIIVTPTALSNGQIQVQIAQANDKFGSLAFGNGNRQTVVNGQNFSSTITVNPNQWTTIGYVNNAGRTSSTYADYNQNMQTPIQIMLR